MQGTVLKIFRDDINASDFCELLDGNKISYQITEREIIIDASDSTKNSIIVEIMENCEDYTLTNT